MTGSSTSDKFRFQRAKLFNLGRLGIWRFGFSTDLVFLNCCRWGASGVFKKVKSLWPTLKYLKCFVRANPSTADVTISFQKYHWLLLAESSRQIALISTSAATPQTTRKDHCPQG